MKQTHWDNGGFVVVHFDTHQHEHVTCVPYITFCTSSQNWIIISVPAAGSCATCVCKMLVARWCIISNSVYMRFPLLVGKLCALVKSPGASPVRVHQILINLMLAAMTTRVLIRRYLHPVYLFIFLGKHTCCAWFWWLIWHHGFCVYIFMVNNRHAKNYFFLPFRKNFVFCGMAILGICRLFDAGECSGSEFWFPGPKLDVASNMVAVRSGQGSAHVVQPVSWASST